MTTPATNRQVADNSILDTFYKQTYLGNACIVPVMVSLGTTNETPVFLLENPALTSSQSFPNQSTAIFVNLRRFTSSDQQVLIKTYIAPTVSGVTTASVPSNLRPASPNTSVSKSYANGEFTVSANGTLISAIGCAADDFVVQDNQLLVILDPGQTMLITATALVETTNLNADVSWYEI